MQNADIVIIGAGIIGLALACGLQGNGLRVIMIENNPPLHDSLHEISQFRVSVINVISKKLLSHLGVWSEIINSNANRFLSVEVWGKDGFGKFTLDSVGSSYGYFGYIVENEVIRNVLWKRVHQCCDIQILTSVALQEVEWRENDAIITLHNGNKLSSRLLIGADGENSWLRKKAGIPVKIWNCKNYAILAKVRTMKKHESVVRKVFQNDEMLTFLPLRDPYLNFVIWSLNPNKAQKLLEITPKIFNQELCIAFDNRLGLCSLEGERKVLPLSTRCAQYFASHRLALVGYAAHAIYTLEEQNTNLGFMDVVELLGELCRLQNSKKDIGQYFYLRRYELNRKYSFAIISASILGIYKIFLGKNTLKRLLRDTAIKTVGMFPGIKQRLHCKAMGIYDLPEWLQ